MYLGAVKNLCSAPFSDPSREQARFWAVQGLAAFEADPICLTLKDRERPQDGFPAGLGKSGSFLSQGSHIRKELAKACPYSTDFFIFFQNQTVSPDCSYGVLHHPHTHCLLFRPPSSSCLGGRPLPFFLTALSPFPGPPEPPDQFSAPPQPATCTQQ